MPYDDAFFDAYRQYLLEPGVRDAHNRVFHAFRRFVGGGMSPRVIDLGCGTGEFFHHGPWVAYVGIDKTPRIAREAYQDRARVIEADYAHVDSWRGRITDPEAFVSLFAIEPTLGTPDRQSLYAQLFEKIPSLKWGLSAGFYYSSKMTSPTVEEPGGIVSYQAIEPLGLYNAIAGVSEERMVMRVPSKMFGPDVVEVWKFFAREPR